MSKRIFFFSIKLLGLLASSILLGFLLMLAAYALPQERMAENLRLSIPALDGQWAREDSYEQLLPGYVGTQLDNSTDAAMLLAAVHESDLPLVTRAVENYTYWGSPTLFQTLCLYDDVVPSSLGDAPVARYWHGYLVFLKPLLLFFSYLDIRMILMMVQGALLAMVIAGLCRNRLERLIFPFLLSLLCITPAITGFSLQFSTAFLTMLLGMIGFLYLPKKCRSMQGQLVLMLFIGILTSFVDYLTYPIVTFGMPCIVCLFRFPLEDAKTEWTRFLLLGLCWVLGYLGMWAGKWVLVGLLGNESWFWPNLIAKISLRSSEVSGEIALCYQDVLFSVVNVFCKKAYLLPMIAAAIAFAVRIVRSRRFPASPVSQNSLRIVLVFIGAIPFFWFFFTQNHTYAHAFYTSRSLTVSVFAGCCLLDTFVRASKGENLYNS